MMGIADEQRASNYRRSFAAEEAARANQQESLTMTADQALRLECLRIAANLSYGVPLEQTVRTAEAFYAFLATASSASQSKSPD